MLEYRSVEDTNRLLVNNLGRFNLDLDLIVGIPRSGMIPATLLALYLNLPLMDLDTFVNGGEVSGGWRTEIASRTKQNSTSRQKFDRVLVIDDSVGSGRAMSIAKDKISKMSKKDISVIYAAVYVLSDKCPHVDIWLETIKCRIFEWNIMNHMFLSNACVDIDGVLCRDPSFDENDDGPRYQHFIETVDPLYRPVFDIGWLVTCRLEKYRAETVQWLAKHQIPYKNLVMLDLPSKQERVAKDCHAEFKAKIFRKTGAIFFIESNYQQAIQIAEMSRKPVFCYETRQMLYHDTVDRLKAREYVKLSPRRAAAWATRPARKALRYLYGEVLNRLKGIV